MIGYRICNKDYEDDTSGYGAKLYGGRWNSPGLPMLYLGQHVSLCALELLVHIKQSDKTTPFSLLYINIPDKLSTISLNIAKLKKNWENDVTYSQFMGDEFIKEKNALILQVPSVLVPEEFNYLLNLLHPDMKKVKIIKTTRFHFDKRLFSFT